MKKSGMTTRRGIDDIERGDLRRMAGLGRYEALRSMGMIIETQRKERVTARKNRSEVSRK
jgi:hypothetical protein